MCQWPLPTVEIVSCHSEWHVDCLSLSLPLVFFCPHFLFNFMSTGRVISFATEQFPCNIHFLMWLLLQMPWPIIGPFLFRGLVYPFQLVNPGLVLCVGLILSCWSFRQLPWWCVEWLSTYLVRWLPYIYLDNSTANAYLCNQGGTLSPFFLGWPAGYWVWLTSTVLLLFQHTFIPISIWRLIICTWVSFFHSGIISLIWLKLLFAFGIYQRWIICWPPPVPLNASIITPWKHHYLCGPWGWMPSTILGHFR